MTYILVTPEISNFVGYASGLLLSYFLNKKYNFKTDNTVKEELPKFILTMSSAYILNLFIFLITYRILEINVYISHIIAGIFYIFAGFLFSYFYVFDVKKR